MKHTPESTTHWACDDQIMKGCCACLQHVCRPVQNIKPLPVNTHLTREEYSKYLENNYDFTIPKFLKI